MKQAAIDTQFGNWPRKSHEDRILRRRGGFGVALPDELVCTCVSFTRAHILFVFRKTPDGCVLCDRITCVVRHDGVVLSILRISIVAR